MKFFRIAYSNRNGPILDFKQYQSIVSMRVIAWLQRLCEVKSQPIENP